MSKKFSLISSYINSNTNNFEYVTTNTLKVVNNAFLKNLNVSGNANFNNIIVNNTITATTFTDGTATLSAGTLDNALLVSSKVFTDGTATLSTGTLSLNELTDGTATLSTGTLSLNELTDGTATLSTGTLSLNELTDGTATLSTGTLSLNELTDGTATLSTGTLSLNELTDGTATLSSGTLSLNELTDGTATLSSGTLSLNELTDGTATLSTGTLSLNELTDGTATLSTGTLSLNELTDGTATLSSGTLSLNELTDGTATLSSGTLSLNELTDGTATLSTGTLSLNELTDGTATLSSGTLSLNELTDGTATLSSGILTTDTIFSNSPSGPKIFSDASQISSGLYFNVTDEVVQVKNAPVSYATSGGDTLVRFQDIASIAASIRLKEECIVATTDNTFAGGTLSYNGSGGLYGQLTITPTTAFITVIDGFTLTVGDRILVKNGQDAPDGTGNNYISNGIYEYAVGTGTPGSGGTQVWNRTSDVPNGVDEAGFLTFVSEGTDNGGISWINNVNPSIIGTHDVTMVKFSTLKIQAGNGISLSTGTPATISIVDDTGTWSSGDVTLTKLTTTGTVSAGLLEGNGVIPIGGIIMWSGTLTDGTIPGSNTNWRLCNGSSYGSVQTPNLSGQFIVGFSASDTDYQAIGAGTDSEGTAIGQKNVTLTSNEIPAHTHSTFGMSNQLQYFGHEYSENGDILRTGADTYNTEGLTQIDVSGYTTGTTGSGNSHNNLPPYYILAYIMRIE
jgi:microcystin-dependent protein